jgi:glucose-6-phosphate 1-dehydrogenase
VPFLIRAGKCLPVTATEVLVKLRKPPLDTLSGNTSNTSNYFRFRLGPRDVSLSLSAQIKRPGEELVSMPAKLTAVEKQTADEVDAYERLLGDAMHGDGMLFVREDAVEAAWAIVEPILANATTLHEYEPESWGPHEAGSPNHRRGRVAQPGIAHRRKVRLMNLRSGPLQDGHFHWRISGLSIPSAYA